MQALRTLLACGAGLAALVAAGPAGASFAPAAGSPVTGLSGPSAVTAADVDADGRSDVIVTESSASRIRVLRNAGGGAGALTPLPPVATGVTPTWIDAGDLDGDGKVDLVVANYGDGTLSLLRGDGAGGFTDFPGSPWAYGGSLPQSVDTGDFDEDGDLDVAVASYGSNEVTVFQGDGLGGLTLLAGPFPVSGGAQSVVAADMDEDGHLDLVYASYGTSLVRVALGHGDGAFGLLPGVSIGAQPFALVVADLDNDGNLDVAAADVGSNAAGVLLGDGGGNLGSLSLRGAGGTQPYGIAAGDLDGDGKTDLAVSHSTQMSVGVLVQNAFGGFTPDGP